MLIREQDRDLYNVWSGPLCRVYTEFFITGQRRRKRKVFIALIISLSDSYRTRGDGENRSGEEREEEQIELHLKSWTEVKKQKKEARCHLVLSFGVKVRRVLETNKRVQSFVRPHLKANVCIPVSNGHTRRQSERPAVREMGGTRWIEQMEITTHAFAQSLQAKSDVSGSACSWVITTVTCF